MVGISLSQAVALQWLKSYELAYGKLHNVEEAVRAGLKPVPERIIDTMRLRLQIRMVNTQQVNPVVVIVEDLDGVEHHYGWRD